MLRLLRFALRNLRRDWRAGELRVLVAALTVAVTAVTGVGLVTERIHRAMLHQAGELLAADLAVVGPEQPTAALRAQAEQAGLGQALTVDFRSVVVADEAIQLVEAKAVGPGYPLRGELWLSDRPWGDERPTPGLPAPGEAWLDPQLALALERGIGDRVQLGELTLTVSAILAREPDRGGDLFSLAPRLMFHLEDLAASGLAESGSTLRYRLLLAGESDDVERFRRTVEAQLSPDQQLIGVRTARPEMEAALDRGERFLGLAALISVLLAGVAIGMSARRHAERHLDNVALLRCLGASQRFTVAVHAVQMVLLGLLGAVLGVAIGWLLGELLALLLAGLFATSLPPAGVTPLLRGVLTGLLVLIGFALPPLLALADVPPLRVLRRDAIGLPLRSLTVYGAAAIALVVLMAWQVRDLELLLWVVGGTLLVLSLFALVAAVLVAALAPLRQRGGVAWRFGLAALARRARTSVAQIVAFGLGFTVLLLLALVRGDLLDEWRASLPEDAPNHFLVDLNADQIDPLRAFLAEAGLEPPEVSPMVRGRLVAINGRRIQPSDWEEPRTQRLVEREFNLSWSDQRPAHNRLKAGQWWQAGEASDQVSFESGLADRLGIGLGDRLTWQVAGREVETEVTSLREVDWDSFRVNFFAILHPDRLDHASASFLTAFHLPPEQRGEVVALVRAFPNVTVIDVDALMGRVREVIDQVVRAVELVFLLTLLAGVTVLLAAIQATFDERRREAAVLRALGARQRHVYAGMATEFIALGALSGLLAAAAASALGYAVATQLFDLPFRVNPWLWLIGVGLGAVGVGLAGALGMRRAVTAPPVEVLRQV